MKGCQLIIKTILSPRNIISTLCKIAMQGKIDKLKDEKDKLVEEKDNKVETAKAEVGKPVDLFLYPLWQRIGQSDKRRHCKLSVFLLFSECLPPAFSIL